MSYCPVDPDSRAFTDTALAELGASGWGPTGWLRFMAQVSVRSGEQIAAHPLAAAQLSLLHGGFLAMSPSHHRRRATWWIGTSWAWAITHLGLLGRRRSIGWANAVSLTRANLPVTCGQLGPWLGLTALATDKLDGTLARRDGPTMFGFYADSLADAAFWTWFGGRRDPNRLVRAATLAAWAAPIVTIGAVSIARGQMWDAPRPALLRPAAAMQAILAMRALRETWNSGAS